LLKTNTVKYLTLKILIYQINVHQPEKDEKGKIVTDKKQPQIRQRIKDENAKQ
jgi:hypothetical protein